MAFLKSVKDKLTQTLTHGHAVTHAVCAHMLNSLVATVFSSKLTSKEITYLFLPAGSSALYTIERGSLQTAPRRGEVVPLGMSRSRDAAVRLIHPVGEKWGHFFSGVRARGLALKCTQLAQRSQSGH